MVLKPKIPGYRLSGRRWKGGNADVWQAFDASGKLVAVKILRIENAKADSYPRFQREVREHAQLTHERVPGVLPLLDQHLPVKPSREDRPWLVTPLATPLVKALGERPRLESVVAAVARIADTLARLHQRSIAHRDVKPSNCYRYENDWVLGDFGLIETPLDVDAALTVGAKAMGPRAFIAPEMVLRAEPPRVGRHNIRAVAWRSSHHLLEFHVEDESHRPDSCDCEMCESHRAPYP